MEYTFKGGIRQHSRASSAERQIVTRGASSVTIPVAAGKKDQPVLLVSPGDHVFLGQPLTSPESGMSAHASVSGTVIAVEPCLLASGESVLSVRIESDGQMEPDPAMEPSGRKLTEVLPDELLAMIRTAGIWTAPAKEPLADRLEAVRGAVPFVIISAMDDDPEIHFAHALLRTHAKAIVGGVKILLRTSGARAAGFAVASDDTKSCFFVREAIGESSYLTLFPVERKYPATHPDILSAMLGRDGQPSLVVTAEECLAVYRAFAAGEPMISRVLTLGGRAVREAGTVRVPIGMSIAEILGQTPLRRTPRLILTGGVMNGRCTAVADVPVEKTTGAILAFGHSHIPKFGYLSPNCFGCDRCAAACPVGLAPGAIFRALEEGNEDAAARMGLSRCIGCGSCTFVCPGMAPVSAHLAKAKVKIKKPAPVTSPEEDAHED